jgi:rhodanese-related sulfurtransferase
VASLRDKLRKASEEIASISVDDAQSLLGDLNVIFVDVREVHELQREGTIPGAVHASRGWLEFTLDPISPSYNAKLTPKAELVIFCSTGMRSLLSAQTMVEMGFSKVRNLDGGFTAWRNRNGPVAAAAADKVTP